MNFNKITLTGAIALIICTTNGFAQVKKKPAPASKAKPKTTVAATQAKPNALPIDPEVLIGKLPNGLTYYIRSNGSIKARASAFLVTKTGSLVETDGQQGAAHFIEHMAFNGTRDFPKSELQKYIKDRGATLRADEGATSSFDQSMYQLALPTDTVDVFEKGFKILANWAGSITFDDADIEKERAVLIEEARTGGKNAQDRLQKQSIPFFLKNSRYALRLPMGKEDVLKTINAATLKSYYQEWYRPNMQAVFIVGDFDPKRVEQLIKDNFSALKNPAAAKPAPVYSVIPTPGTSINFATDKDFIYLNTQIVTLHPQNVIKTTTDYMQSIRVNLFNQMLNTRMSEAVNQRSSQLIGADANYGPFLGKQNAFTVIAATRTGLEPAIKAVVAETERARKFGFTVTELERAKQNALIAMGNAFQGKNQTISSGFISQYIQHFINDDPIPGIDYEYSFYSNNIGKITLGEMNALATSYITPQNRAIMIQAPDSEKSKLPNEATILTWITDAGKNVAAYVDETDEPFLTKLPVAGKVVSTMQDTIISTTKLTLSNGVKVILKPTQFTNGQILINGYSFGGTSLASSQDLLSATFADKMIPLSGVGDLTQAQLDKRLTSKRINISPYISELTQGISGSSVPDDFEAAMQLLYLYFTQPRKDAAVWQDILSQAKSTIARRAADPLSAYQDTITGILNSHNPRAMPATFDKVDAASIDKAYDFYKNRFADASGFTFTFVGSFEVAGIIPFLETYLGSLPATNKKETYKNLGMSPQSGQISRTFTKGTAENASIQLTYSGSYVYNEANNIQLDALESILNTKLGTRLTEKDGAFAPGASIKYVKIPEGRYEINVFVDAKPAEADKVANIILDEISKLKQTGADAKEIERFTILDARATQGNFRQNVFWAGYLSTTSQNEEDPDNLLQRIQKLNEITPQTTKDAANKYLSGTNLIKLILLPEKK